MYKKNPIYLIDPLNLKVYIKAISIITVLCICSLKKKGTITLIYKIKVYFLFVPKKIVKFTRLVI